MYLQRTARVVIGDGASSSTEGNVVSTSKMREKGAGRGGYLQRTASVHCHGITSPITTQCDCDFAVIPF